MTVVTHHPHSKLTFNRSVTPNLVAKQSPSRPLPKKNTLLLYN